jgi:hypothetical protein
MNKPMPTDKTDFSQSAATNAAGLVTDTYPRSCPRSKLFTVRVNGETVFAHHTDVADFAAVECSDAIEVEVEVSAPITAVRMRPLSRGIEAEIESTRVRFSLDGPTNVSVEIAELKPLFFYANPPEKEVPSPHDSMFCSSKPGKSMRSVN